VFDIYYKKMKKQNCKDNKLGYQSRDKNGKWHSLESYLNREADIDFSHGICPECGKKHYPEFLGSDKD
jgi:hypothetical protein